MDTLRRTYYALVLLLLAACGGPSGDASDVPTAFVLPTLTSTPTLPPTVPATWTPTLTWTPSLTPTLTATFSVTPSLTITDTPTATATNTASPTVEPNLINLLAQLAQQATVLPPDFFTGGAADNVIVATQAALGNCPILPAGGFGLVFTNNPDLAQQLGCPAGSPPVAASLSAATQPFERGMMIWLEGSPPLIYVFQTDGAFLRFDDTYNAAVDPYAGGEIPPSNLFEPVRGFGKVWRTYANVRTNLGWALSLETPAQSTVQAFERGRMIHIPARGDVLVLIEDPGGASGRWVSVPGGF